MSSTRPLLRLVAVAAIVAQLTGPRATPASGQAATAQRSRTPAASSTEAAYRVAADAAGEKFHRVRVNATKPHPDQTPTVFTEREINAYIGGGRVRLPRGVKNVRFRGDQGVVTADATVDFDQVTAGRRNSNPLMSLFSGVHEVEAISHAQGLGGEARVHIDSVSIDGVGVPRIALEFFVNRYVKPRYPNLGLDSRFKTPEKIDTATVGNHILSVTQK